MTVFNLLNNILFSCSSSFTSVLSDTFCTSPVDWTELTIHETLSSFISTLRLPSPVTFSFSSMPAIRSLISLTKVWFLYLIIQVWRHIRHSMNRIRTVMQVKKKIEIFLTFNWKACSLINSSFSFILWTVLNSNAAFCFSRVFILSTIVKIDSRNSATFLKSCNPR